MLPASKQVEIEIEIIDKKPQHLSIKCNMCKKQR